jgi:hypothetical protein
MLCSSQLGGILIFNWLVSTSRFMLDFERSGMVMCTWFMILSATYTTTCEVTVTQGVTWEVL